MKFEQNVEVQAHAIGLKGKDMKEVQKELKAALDEVFEAIIEDIQKNAKEKEEDKEKEIVNPDFAELGKKLKDGLEELASDDNLTKDDVLSMSTEFFNKVGEINIMSSSSFEKLMNEVPLQKLKTIMSDTVTVVIPDTYYEKGE